MGFSVDDGRNSVKFQVVFDGMRQNVDFYCEVAEFNSGAWYDVKGSKETYALKVSEITKDGDITLGSDDGKTYKMQLQENNKFLMVFDPPVSGPREKYRLSVVKEAGDVSEAFA